MEKSFLLQQSWTQLFHSKTVFNYSRRVLSSYPIHRGLRSLDRALQKGAEAV